MGCEIAHSGYSALTAFLGRRTDPSLHAVFGARGLLARRACRCWRGEASCGEWRRPINSHASSGTTNHERGRSAVFSDAFFFSPLLFQKNRAGYRDCGSSALSPGHFLGRGGKEAGDSRERADFRAVSVWKASICQALQAAPTLFR